MTNKDTEDKDILPTDGIGFTPKSAKFAMEDEIKENQQSTQQEYYDPNTAYYDPNYTQQFDPNYQYNYQDPNYQYGGQYYDPNNPQQQNPSFVAPASVDPNTAYYDPNYTQQFDPNYQYYQQNGQYPQIDPGNANVQYPEYDSATVETVNELPQNPQQIPPINEEKPTDYTPVLPIQNIEEKTEKKVEKKEKKKINKEVVMEDGHILSAQNREKLNIDLSKVGIIAVSSLAVLMTLLFVLELSSNTISGLFGGNVSVYEKCKNSGGSLNSQFPFSCTNKDGQIVFKDSTVSDQSNQLLSIENSKVASGYITLSPQKANEYNKEIVGKNNGELQTGLTTYKKYTENLKQPYVMVINNSNLSSSKEKSKTDLISRVNNFLKDGQNLSSTPYLIDLFKFDESRNFDMIELGKFTNITYPNVDESVAFYTIDGDTTKLDLSTNVITVRIIAKKNDNYILLEKILEGDIISKINADNKTGCFKNGSASTATYTQEKDCYLSKIKANIPLTTKAQEAAYELVESFKL